MQQKLDNIRGFGEVVQGRATPAEYWELISGEMNTLYLLSFLLTADKEKAEQCLDQTLDDFVEGREDFIDWARKRGRDAVLKHASGMMKPDPEATQVEMDFRDGLQCLDGSHIFGAITSLPTFERFVFVMTKIYGQSDTECAAHLVTTRWEVSIARELTEQILATTNDGGPGQGQKPAPRFEAGYIFDPRYSSC
jgi:hypothetical protein